MSVFLALMVHICLGIHCQRCRYRQALLLNNGERTELSVRMSTKSSYSANEIFVSGDDVYIAVMTTNGLNIKVPCYWKNGNRTDLSMIDATKLYHTANSVYVSNGNVYLAGYTSNINNIQVPCFWINGIRADLSVIDSNSAGRANAIALYSRK